jgi:hypothetical protein
VEPKKTSVARQQLLSRGTVGNDVLFAVHVKVIKELL